MLKNAALRNLRGQCFALLLEEGYRKITLAGCFAAGESVPGICWAALFVRQNLTAMSARTRLEKFDARVDANKDQHPIAAQ